MKLTKTHKIVKHSQKLLSRNLLTILGFVLMCSGLNAQKDSSMVPLYNPNPFLNIESNSNYFFELPPCPYTIKTAKENIEKDSIVLVIEGGLTGFPKMDEHQLYYFSSKYNLAFDYVGCVKHWDNSNEDINGYNQVIMNYLKTKYGEKVTIEYNKIFVRDIQQNETLPKPIFDN